MRVSEEMGTRDTSVEAIEYREMGEEEEDVEERVNLGEESERGEEDSCCANDEVLVEVDSLENEGRELGCADCVERI
jgi:hypothetical protein